MSICLQTLKLSLKQCTLFRHLFFYQFHTETETSITNAKLLELLSLSFEKVYEQDDRGPNQNLKTCLSSTNTEMSQLAQYLLDNEYEIMSMQSTVTKPIAPIVLRAQFIKKQLEETKTLTANLENREAEIRQLKLASKMKQSELSEMQIRKDLAEKKLSVLQNDHEINTEKLQRKYDETMQLLKKYVMIFLAFMITIDSINV